MHVKACWAVLAHSLKSFVYPERLPPTSSSIKFYGVRVYYQIMVWIGTDDGMDALEWGWKVDNNQTVLLKMTHYNCESCLPHCSCRIDMCNHAMLDVDHTKLIHVTTYATIT